MEENKFEKQVQQKMDEFSVSPSEDVWKKIQVRIEKRRRPKWLMLILILFFITAGGGFWLWSDFQLNPSRNNLLPQESKQEMSAQNNPAQKNITVEKIHVVTDSVNNEKNTAKKNSGRWKEIIFANSIIQKKAW